MNNEAKAKDMKMLTDLDQVNELLRVGYPLPQYHRTTPAYTIGELINFAKQCAGDIIITNNRTNGWFVGVHSTHVANFEGDELIDSLFKFCMWIKLNAYFPYKSSK